jgi:hypothetical protein
VSGYRRRAYDTIDSGKVRNLADSISAGGYPHANQIASIVMGKLSLELMGKGNGTEKAAKKKLLSTDRGHMRREFESDVDGYTLAAMEVSKYKSDIAGWLPPRVAGVVLYEARKISNKKADEWFEGVATGEGLTPGDPRKLLRARLLRAVMRRSRLMKIEILALTIRSWNAYKAGKTLKKLQYNTSDPFPTIK